METTENVWNWLEVSKLIASGLTPILVVLIGLFINQRLKRFEHKQWRNQKLIEKRLSIYDELTPLLNDLLYYYTFVGSWKDFTPIEMVSKKREIDKKIYLASPMFCKEFFTACNSFINICYASYNDWGQDAKLKTKSDRRRASFGVKWVDDWDQCFFEDNCPTYKEIRAAYNSIMRIFSIEIGLQDYCFDE